MHLLGVLFEKFLYVFRLHTHLNTRSENEYGGINDLKTYKKFPNKDTLAFTPSNEIANPVWRIGEKYHEEHL
jgi:hypothetical protein